MRLLFFLAISLLFSSCSAILGFALGIRNFQNETKAQFVKSIKKRGYSIDTNDVFKIFDKNLLALKLVTNDRDSSTSLLQFRMYDSVENFIAFHANFCSGKPLEYILQDSIPLNYVKKYPEYNTILLNSKISDYFDLVDERNFKQKFMNDLGKYDYYAVMYAGKFSLKYQIKKLEAIEEYEKKFNKKIKVYYLLIYDEPAPSSSS